MNFTNAIYLNFLCLCVFCFFFLQVVTKWFSDDFWRPLMPFSTFLFWMLIVLWCSTPFTAVFFRMKNLRVFNAAARWRSCTCLKRVSGHGRLEKHAILVMHTSLRNGAQIFSDINRRTEELGYTSRFLRCLGENVCMVYWHKFFSHVWVSF